VWSVHGQKEDDEAGEERVQMELEIPIWGTIAAVSSVKVPVSSRPYAQGGVIAFAPGTRSFEVGELGRGQVSSG
jgi:hypothetical protein